MRGTRSRERRRSSWYPFHCAALGLTTLLAVAPAAAATPEVECAARAMRPAELVEVRRAAGEPFPLVDLLTGDRQLSTKARGVPDELARDSVLHRPNPRAVARLLARAPASLTLQVHGPSGLTELELVRVEVTTPDFRVLTSDSHGQAVPYQPGLHYRGKVKGDPDSHAAVSVFRDEVMGLFFRPADGTVVIGRLLGDNPAGEHIVYAAHALEPHLEFTCRTPDEAGGDGEPATGSGEQRLAAASTPLDLLAAPAAGPAAKATKATKCVKVYVETEYDLYQNKGSVQAVTDYVTGFFNQSATLYSNEQIPIALSELFVWSSNDPYSGSDASSHLSGFQSYRNSFNGDVGHLVALGNSGIAAGFNAFCSSNIDNRQCYSGVESSYANVPTYSHTVMVFTHEMGHLFGSRHTHACVWNGNNTAIDGCAAVEGSCPRPGYPSGGGTIMSYCSFVQGVGVNFNNGFGQQPGNLIRSRFNNATCLGDCGGGCTYSISPTSASQPAGGGSGSVSVDASATSCQWSASSNSSWLSITAGSSGTGDGTVSYSAAANGGAARSGTLTVAGKTFTVSQAAGGGGGSCTGGTTYTGSLAGTGASQYQPNGSYYYSAASGTHSGNLSGPAGTDFDLYLQKWNGSSWSTVASGEGSTSTESVSYNGTAGYYRWRIYSYSGSGSYSLCARKP